jgi:hypothetical protein
MAAIPWTEILAAKGMESPGYLELLAKFQAARAERLANPSLTLKSEKKGGKGKK